MKAQTKAGGISCHSRFQEHVARTAPHHRLPAEEMGGVTTGRVTLSDELNQFSACFEALNIDQQIKVTAMEGREHNAY